MTIIVDAHQHFWNYGTYQSSWMGAPPYAGDPVYQPLQRSFQPNDLLPELKAAGVDHRGGVGKRRSGISKKSGAAAR